MTALIPVCKLRATPKNREYAILINEKLFRFTSKHSKDNMHVVIQNYQFIARGADDKCFTSLFHSYQRCSYAIAKDKQWHLVVQLIEKSFLQAPPEAVIATNEAFQAYISFMTFLIKCKDTGLLQLCYKLAKAMDKLFAAPELIRCNEIVVFCFQMAHESAITTAGLFELKTYFKDIKTIGSNVNYQRTITLISKLFTNNIHLFEETADCFVAYHNLIYSSFLNIVKSMKNEENIYSCCNDIKRHEGCSLVSSMIAFATPLVTNGQYNKTVGKYLNFHVNYGYQLCSELKCTSKDRDMTSTFYKIYNTMCEFAKNKSLVSIENYPFLHEIIKVMFKFWHRIVAVSNVTPDIVILRIYESPTNSNCAVYSANGLASLLFFKAKLSGNCDAEFVANSNKFQLKVVYALREALKMMKISSISDFIKSKSFQDAGFNEDSSLMMTTAEITLLEIQSASRYSDSNQKLAYLLTTLCSATEDPKVLAQAFSLMIDDVLKLVDKNIVQQAHERIEKYEKLSKTSCLDISLALAQNNYNLFFLMNNDKVNDLQKSYEAAADSKCRTTLKQLQLKDEFALLHYLNESLRHFTIAAKHLMTNKDSIQMLVTRKRMVKTFNNLASQFHLRGIKYKDIETHIVLWNFAQLFEDDPQTTLNSAIFFIDNSHLLLDTNGSYVRISKQFETPRLEELVLKANKVLDDLMPTFDNQTEYIQTYILCYLLSLWLHYITHRRISDGWKCWSQFEDLWKSWKVDETNSNRNILLTKIYFCLVEINLKCCNRNADSFLSHAIQHIMDVKTIDREFSYQYQLIYQRVALQAISYSLNRLTDIERYNVLMVTLKAMACRKGYCFKVLDLLSISIQRYLTMEKMDQAKVINASKHFVQFTYPFFHF